MSDKYLLRAVAEVTGPEGLNLLECALENCHYNRYTFRRCGEQLTRELADGWESLRAAIRRAEDVFKVPRLSSSLSLQQGLRQEVRCGLKLLAEVVALLASCIPTAFSTRDRRRVEPYEVSQKHEGIDHFFHEVHRNERSLQLAPEMKAALHEIDLSLASASLYEMNTLLGAESREQKSNENEFRVRNSSTAFSVQFGDGSTIGCTSSVS